MSRKSAKTQHGSTTKPRRNNAQPAARPASSTLADLQEQVGALTHDLAEARKQLVDALDQQIATADVLKVISQSPSELQPVLDTIVEIAAHLCQAGYSFIWKLDDGIFHLAAINNVEADF